MGRELKRVPLDFNWPQDKKWVGYVNPYYEKSHKCQDCNGTGATTAHQRLSDLVSLLMLSGEDALRGKCHPYFFEAPLHSTQGKTCGKDMAELTTGLAERAHHLFFGHDSCNNWSAVRKIIAASGLPEDWGTCQTCDGDGLIWKSPEDERASEAWTPSEPPQGEGYQIWETVSEGSPISPVFATPEELARYMAGTHWGSDRGSSYESWMHFIKGSGFAVSMLVTADGAKTGPDAA